MSAAHEVIMICVAALLRLEPIEPPPVQILPQDLIERVTRVPGARAYWSISRNTAFVMERDAGLVAHEYAHALQVRNGENPVAPLQEVWARIAERRCG